MLDSFEILTTSGVVLWSKKYSAVGSNLINSLINDVFIEERGPATANPSSGVSASRNPPYKKEKYTLRWTAAKDLGLIFVAVYQSIIHLTWVEKLLDNIRILFCDLYGDQLKKPHTSVVSCETFDGYFDRQVQELEKLGSVISSDAADVSSASPSEYTPPSSSGEAELPEKPSLTVPVPQRGLPELQRPISRDGENTSTEVTPVPTPDTSRPSTPSTSHLVTAKGGLGGRLSRRARKAAAASSRPQSSGDESRERRPKANEKLKKPRRWDADGLADDDDDDVELDFSTKSVEDRPDVGVPLDAVSQDSWGRKTKKGEFILKDLDEEMDAILSNNAQDSSNKLSTGLVGSSLGAISGLFRSVVGGKTLTNDDLVKPLRGVEEHLLKKNVAREAAVRLCEQVERDLVGTKTDNFTSVDTTIQNSMEAALRKILTPTSSLDLLREIQSVIAPGPSFAAKTPRPYVMSIVGVNGVGKSTNLSKICFFLLQNQFRILVVAADTFRSGAVEQLRVHVRNLKELSAREGGAVELFEKGYGKDAANVAADAVKFAAANHFDVVLIDTAGRRHNDQRLMSSLEKFAKMAQPDKILMVGEALVGTDSVQQARNFNAAFGAGRNLDGFIISKCDTVGDMVGTLVSMVHATGIPVVFLGTGQHYSDLRTLNISHVVRLLMN